MKAKIIAVAASALLAASCGTAVTGTPHGATHRPPRALPALPAMGRVEKTQDCAALALVRTGVGTYLQEVQTIAGQSGVAQHVAAGMIAKNVHQNCPGEVSVLP